MKRVLEFIRGNIGSVTILTSLIILEIWLTIAIPESRKYLYDALASKNMSLFWPSFGFFMLVLVGLLFELPYKEYIRSILSLNLREYLVNVIVRDNLTKKNISNADGRASDDVNIITSISTRAAVEIIIALICFVGLIGQTVHDPILLWSAIGYSVVLCFITCFFKTPLLSAKLDVQNSEQDFRRSLIEDNKPLSRYETVMRAIKRLLSFNLYYGLFMQAKNRIVMIILPIILLPMYMSGSITIGDVFAKLALFDLIIENATIVLIYFPDITSFMASYERVKVLFEK